MRRGQIEHGAPEDYERVDEMGNAYAQGGSVHLASGGRPIPNPEDVQGTFSYAPGYYAEIADNIAPDGKTAGYNDAARHMLAAADLTRRIGNVPLVGKRIAGPLVKGLGYGGRGHHHAGDLCLHPDRYRRRWHGAGAFWGDRGASEVHGAAQGLWRQSAGRDLRSNPHV